MGVDEEETDALGVVIAGTSSVSLSAILVVGAISTDKVRGGSAGPRS